MRLLACLLLLAPLLLAQEDEIARLKSSSATERREAALALGAMGRDAQAAVPALIEALQDRNGLVRGAAILALGRIGHPDAVAPLVGQLRAPDARTQANAARALAGIGAPAVPALRKALREEERASARAAAARALDLLEDPGKEAAADLVEALEDADPSVRVAAARALRGRAQAATVLYAALKSDDPALVKAAAAALGERGPHDETTARALAAVLEAEDHGLRWSAARALGRIGEANRTVLPELARALRTSDYAARTAIASVLAQAGPAGLPHVVKALREARHDISAHAAFACKGMVEAATQALTPLLGSADLRLAARAARTLRALGQEAPGALERLRPGLAAPDGRTALEVGRAVWELSEDAAAIAPLTRALAHEDPVVRGEAAEALGAIGPRALDAVPALEKAAQDEDERVRMRARRALEQIQR